MTSYQKRVEEITEASRKISKLEELLMKSLESVDKKEAMTTLYEIKKGLILETAGGKAYHRASKYTLSPTLYSKVKGICIYNGELYMFINGSKVGEKI